MDAFERVLEALVRMSASVVADAQRYGAVLKRAGKVRAGAGPSRLSDISLPKELSRLLIAVLAQQRMAPH